MDWLKKAKELQSKERKVEREDLASQQASEKAQQLELNWLDRVLERVREVSKEGFPLHTKVKGNELEISGRGKLKIDYKGPQSFEVLYHDVTEPSTLLIRRPVTVRHHRVVRLRHLAPQNVEEVLKFAVMGMKDYCKVAKYSRIERNLAGVTGISRVDEQT